MLRLLHCFRDWQVRLPRRLIHTGRLAGMAGAAGRWWGRRVGWKLRHGPRIIIDNPREAIQSDLLYKGVYEPGVAEVLVAALRPGDLFLDVGANVGHHTLIAAHRQVRVQAFEPVPRIAQRLRDNVRLNRLGALVSVRESALSSRSGSATLFVAAREDDGSHSLIEGVPAESVQPLRVRTKTLDQHLADHGNCSVRLVKIDVEGAEALVLDGARATLARADRPLVLLETGDRLAERIGESAASVLQRLFDRGYRVFRIDEAPVRIVAVQPGQVSSQVLNYLAVPERASHVDALMALSC